MDEGASAEDPALIGRFVGVSLQVDDIQSTSEQLLEKRVEFESSPERQTWSAAFVHLKHTSGNVITYKSKTG